MKRNLGLFTALAVFLSVIFTGCNNSGEKKDKESTVVEAEEGEEDGTQLARSDVYDLVKNGTHLVLKFDKESSVFVGTVENISDDLIENVRVEVHLSNGTELGPTTPIAIKPGGVVEVKLDAEGQEFETWSSHAEVGSSEHSHEGGEAEHSNEEEGEHGGEGESEHR